MWTDVYTRCSETIKQFEEYQLVEKYLDYVVESLRLDFFGRCCTWIGFCLKLWLQSKNVTLVSVKIF